MKRKTKRLLWALLPPLLLAIALLVTQLLPRRQRPVTKPDGLLEVHFIDVGQGDSILIRQGGDAMLIDAGTEEAGQTVVDYLNRQGVASLTYAVGTHPHGDHIGGLDKVLRAIPTKTLLMPDIPGTTWDFEEVLDAAEDCGLRITAPEQGDTYSVGAALVTSLQSLDTDDYNNASLILRLDYGDHAFLFTGDAEAEAEAALLRSRAPVDCDVLKVGHHGSTTSTTEGFLRAASPDFAVISCGVGNEYGHPHREIRDAFSESGIRVLRTDHHGTVVASTDGSALTWNVELRDDGREIYVVDNRANVFHAPACPGAESVSVQDKELRIAPRQELRKQGCTPCNDCRP